MSVLKEASRDGCLNEGFFSTTPSDLFSLAAIRSAFPSALNFFELVDRAPGETAASRGAPLREPVGWTEGELPGRTAGGAPFDGELAVLVFEILILQII